MEKDLQMQGTVQVPGWEEHRIKSSPWQFKCNRDDEMKNGERRAQRGLQVPFRPF